MRSLWAKGDSSTVANKDTQMSDEEYEELELPTLDEVKEAQWLYDLRNRLDRLKYDERLLLHYTDGAPQPR
jgi:hypothetical protein